MTNWHDFVGREGTTPSWPYPVDYEKENLKRGRCEKGTL